MEPTMTFAALAPLRREPLRRVGLLPDRGSAGAEPSVRRAQRAGFTLVELLVAISVIVLLVGLLVPMALKARNAAKKARIAADLNAIVVGLDAYKTDFGDYPRLPPGVASD